MSGYGCCEGCDSAEFTECKGSMYNTNGGDSMSDAKMNIAWTGQLLAPLHYTHPKLNTIGTSAPYTEAMHMQATGSLNSLYIVLTPVTLEGVFQILYMKADPLRTCCPLPLI